MKLRLKEKLEGLKVPSSCGHSCFYMWRTDVINIDVEGCLLYHMILIS